MWRLRESPMHHRSHTAGLPVHLYNKHTVIFEERNEEDALDLTETGKTKLTEWFQLNKHDPDARQWLYTDIPLHYVYEKRTWKKRQRGAKI